jgi:hypothetical protein
MACTPTTTIAFGGYLYSIAKWLPGIQHYRSGAWGFTDRWCQDFASQLRRPVRLIGFSEGANAVMAIASYSSQVVRAFFATMGDTTPTFDGTVAVARRAMANKAPSDIQFLKYQGFENPTWFERTILAPRKHIFHNVLPHLGF